jgi:aldehyde dehydrogenase family 7 member A1
MIATKASRWIITRGCSSRRLSTRVTTILSALDIPVSGDIPGVYDGQWRGAGDIFESKCPTTGEVLARVKSVSGNIGVQADGAPGHRTTLKHT